MAEKQTKTVNYTDAQTATAKEMYAKGATVDSIAAAIGKTPKSITAKLVREGVYKKAEKKVEGAGRTLKTATADAIGKVLKLSESDTASLVGCTKKTLDAIFSALANSKPIE